MAKRKKSSQRGGRGNPPRETQFKPGQSGNPRGRPKGSGRLTKIAHKEAARRIAYTENGVRKNIRTDAAIVRQALIGAAKGDFRALPIALKLLDRDQAGADAAGTQEVLGGPEDQLVMASIVQRIRQTPVPPDPSSDAAERPGPSLPPTSDTKEQS
jgi:hypothetical protein